MQLLFIDTETTGKTEKDYLIQIACQLEGESMRSEYFKPPVPINYEAMAVHHITNEMVSDKPSFQDSEFKKWLESKANDVVLVAHNAPFDLGMLEKEGLVFPNWIDTCRVARHLIESENHQLQYLRYSLGLNVEGEAHEAAGDVKVLVALYDVLKARADAINSAAIIQKMIDLSVLPVTLKIFNFGKYFGQSFEYIAEIDPKYMAWLYGKENEKFSSEQNKDLLFTLEKYKNRFSRYL